MVIVWSLMAQKCKNPLFINYPPCKGHGKKNHLRSTEMSVFFMFGAEFVE